MVGLKKNKLKELELRQFLFSWLWVEENIILEASKLISKNKPDKLDEFKEWLRKIVGEGNGNGYKR